MQHFHVLQKKLPRKCSQKKSWIKFSNKVLITEATIGGGFLKKVFLNISPNLQENTCARLSFLIKLQALGLQACNVIKKETLAQMCSWEFRKIFKNTSGGCCCNKWADVGLQVSKILLY